MFFLPYKVNRPFKLPLLTIALIAVNVLVFAGSVPFIPRVFEEYGFRADSASAFYTWFSYMFLHADPLHLLGNMYFLWLFGSVVEDAIGRMRYTLLYLSGGLAAALIHAIVTAVWTPAGHGIPLVGASGAMAAIIGVFAVRMYKNKVSVFWFIGVFFFWRWGTFQLTSVAAIALWLGREVFDGTIAILAGGSSVANWAHVGGAVFGGLVAVLFGLAKDADVEFLTEEAAGYAATGVHNVAADRYSKLVETDPENPQWHLDRAREMLAGAGGRETAARDIAKGIELLACGGRNPEVVLAYDQLAPLLGDLLLPARTLLTMGSACEAGRRLDLAATAYWDLVQRHPDSREAEKALFRLPHVYLAAEMPDHATSVWRSFVETYPASEWIPYADRALEAAS